MWATLLIEPWMILKWRTIPLLCLIEMSSDINDAPHSDLQNKGSDGLRSPQTEWFGKARLSSTIVKFHWPQRDVKARRNFFSLKARAT